MLDLDRATRQQLWEALTAEVEDYLETVAEGPAVTGGDPADLERFLAGFDFSAPREPVALLRQVAGAMRRHQVHAAHPAYFGLFNPRPTAMGIAADGLAAALNPQLAAWSHSPLAVEIEQHLLRSFAVRFGYPENQSDGTFASGGAEANLTAVLVALEHAFPGLKERGLRQLPGDPVLYVSEESHHSVQKAAVVTGLGTEAVQVIPVDRELRLDPVRLRARIEADRTAGRRPFLVVGTAGTTGAGAIDPLGELARIARAEGMWLHVDAAWGGAAALVPELAPLLAGIELADSITMDAHKWLSLPMGAGMFLTRHPGVLDRVFGISTSYMPREAAQLSMVNPYTHSLQWSRRFIGLKLFLSLAVAGWDGYAAAIRGQHEVGILLRERLPEAGWRVANHTVLPLVCFVDARYAGTDPDGHHQRIANRVVGSGAAWISTVRLGANGPLALRACITNYRTGTKEIEELLTLLDRFRQEGPEA